MGRESTKGRIVVDGVVLSEMRGHDEVLYLRSKIGFVFQSYYLIPNLTAKENVMLPMDIAGVSPKTQEEMAKKLLERVGIDATRQRRRPTRLSGGEQQRVVIARAQANDPALILADELTGNLDSKTGKKIVELLYSLTRREGRTVILATHDVALASKADVILHMEDGKLH